MQTRTRSGWGVPIALAVMSAWAGHLAWVLLRGPPALLAPATLAHVLVQGYLFTGLFITGHDAMHGTVSRSPRVNAAFGWAACFLFAGLSYGRLVVNHRGHHASPATAADPDFSERSGAFWVWLGTFMVRYTTWRQLVVMALAYNLLHWSGVAEWRIWTFWVVPALLGTLQLFYFGTYLPHRRPHTAGMAPHAARTQTHGHLWALLSCYFFGYHWEHHASPATPWWALWRVKDARALLPLSGVRDEQAAPRAAQS